ACLVAAGRAFAADSGSLFFFSSRRRHTICYRDWSSDVCSSDLAFAAAPTSFLEAGSSLGKRPRIWVSAPALRPSISVLRSESRRSEERRVGKGGRWGGRWWLDIRKPCSEFGEKGGKA